MTVYLLMKCSLNYIFQGGREIGGIFIKTLLPDGAAEQTGSILVGMALSGF